MQAYAVSVKDIAQADRSALNVTREAIQGAAGLLLRTSVRDPALADIKHYLHYPSESRRDWAYVWLRCRESTR